MVDGSLGMGYVYDRDQVEALADTPIYADTGLYLGAVAAASAAAAAWDAEVVSFNTEAATYNKAATAYNDEVKAQELDKPTTAVPTRPCPPSALPALGAPAFDLVAPSGQYDPTVDTGILVRSFTDGLDSDQAAQSRKIGYLATAGTYADNAAVADYDDTDMPAGHVYGRLGQGKNNMPGVMAPWSYEQDANASDAIMYISVLPAHEDFEVATAAISIQASMAKFATKVEATAAAESADKLDDLLGAKMIAASAASLLALSTLF